MSNCNHKIPHLTGGMYLPHIPGIDCDGDVHFTGIENITISQGTEIDLREGVHAYDGNGNEIPFVVSPSAINECSVRVHDITYTAIGLNKTMLPHFPNAENELEVYPPSCETSEVTAHRRVTIVAVSAPVIYGVTDLEVTAPYTLDTLQGVSAVDANGNTVAVTASPSGSVEYTSEGTYSVVYTAVDKCGNTSTTTRTVVVSQAEPPEWMISPTGIDGYVPPEYNDPFVSMIALPPAVRTTVENVIDYAIAGSHTPERLAIAILTAYMMKYSHYIVYDTDYAGILNADPWEYVMDNPELFGGVIPGSGDEYLTLVEIFYRGWLAIYDTPITYPVMHGHDNEYYAWHDMYRRTRQTGSIYLDYRNALDYSDDYNIIYGHHVENSSLFGDLYEYANVSYFNAHKDGILVDSNGVYQLTAFAVVRTDAYEANMYLTGDRAEAVKEFLESGDTGVGVGTQVMHWDVETAESADRILALSTCAHSDTNERLVVLFSMQEREFV